MVTKKSSKFNRNQIATYIIKYAISPDYDVDFFIEKTGTYPYVRSCALMMASSGNCVILDISKK